MGGAGLHAMAQLSQWLIGLFGSCVGLYQLVDPQWYWTVTCDWQCRPEGYQEPVTRTSVAAPAPLQSQTLDEKDARLSQDAQRVSGVGAAGGRTKCSVPLSDSDARIGLYQMVDHRWNYVASCDWQCKPFRGQRRSTAVRPSGATTRPSEAAARAFGVPGRPSDVAGRPSAALSDARYRLIVVIILLITSAKEVMFLPVFVCLFVCL